MRKEQMEESFDDGFFDPKYEQNGEVSHVISYKPKGERVLRSKPKKVVSKKMESSEEEWDQGQEGEMDGSGKQKSSEEMGRKFNSQAQKEHIKESKKYNEITYHFVRMNLFVYQKFKIAMKCVQVDILSNKKDFSKHEVMLIEKCQKLMNAEVFPKFGDQKISFLLHPKSLHYLFSEIKKEKNTFSSSETKIMLLTYFSEKKLLSTELREYIDSYWQNIVRIAAEKEQDRQNQIPGNIANEDYERNIGEAPITVITSNKQKSKNKKIIAKTKLIEKAPKKEKKKAVNKTSEKVQLQKELGLDESIIAYEIACYIHYIFKLYDLKFIPN